MRKKDYRGARCQKIKAKKSEEVLKLYDRIQVKFVELLDGDDNVKSFECNVELDVEGGYTTDFLITKTNGDFMVRECVFRDKLSLPRTAALLDLSREYWLKRGINDWGIVIERGDKDDYKD